MKSMASKLLERFGDNWNSDPVSNQVAHTLNWTALEIEDLEKILNKYNKDSEKPYYSREEAAQISKEIRKICTSLLSTLDILDSRIGKK